VGTIDGSRRNTKRRAITTSGMPIRTEEAILPTSCPLKKWRPEEPNASERKTTLSSGALATVDATTRMASCTRPRSGAPTRLSTVSETMNAARLAPTIRHVEPTARSKGWPGNAGCEWTTIAMYAARSADPTNPAAIISCAFSAPSRRVGAEWCAI
jgi:hypothetical protein